MTTERAPDVIRSSRMVASSIAPEPGPDAALTPGTRPDILLALTVVEC
jgi:hypothetical protein